MINKKGAGYRKMDTVVGRTKAYLLVMTERKHNLELIFKLPSKTERTLVEQLNKLEKKLGAKRFKEVSRSITCDNGCENLDAHGFETSIVTGKQRTTVYYAHPYSAYERGADEGANVFIRRFVPKGTDVNTLSRAAVKRIAHWMNHYPRRKLHYATAFEASPLSRILRTACVIYSCNFHFCQKMKKTLDKKNVLEYNIIR